MAPPHKDAGLLFATRQSDDLEPFLAILHPNGRQDDVTGILNDGIAKCQEQTMFDAIDRILLRTEPFVHLRIDAEFPYALQGN